MHHSNQCPGLPTGSLPFAQECAGNSFFARQTWRKKHARWTSINIDKLHHVSSSLIASASSPFWTRQEDSCGSHRSSIVSLGAVLPIESNNRNRLADILPSKDIQTILNTVRLRSKRMCWLVATSYYRTTPITAQNGLATAGFQALHTHHTSKLLDTMDSDSDAVLKLTSSNIHCN